MYFKEITDKLFICKFEKDNQVHIFTLKKQDIGVYGYGKSLVLRGKLLDDNAEVIASLWLKDDGYEGYKKDGYKSKLWNTDDAKRECLIIIRNIIESIF